MADQHPAHPASPGCLEAVALLANPATSYWLKNALVTAFERDPFDAERDALVLAAVLTRNLDAIVARHFAGGG